MKTPVLVDRFDRPIDFAALKRNRPGPTISGVRSVVTGHPADGLDPRRLARILRDAEQGSPQAYLELAEQMEERYPQYLSVLGTRKRAVCQLDITVDAYSDEPRDVEIADFIRAWLKKKILHRARFDMLDAVGKGFSVTRLRWGMLGGYQVPVALEWWDPRWIEFDPVDGRTPLVRGDDGGGLERFAPYEIIFHEAKAKSGLPIRGGLARVAAWAYLFQSFGLKDWVAFAEVYGLPLRLGKYDNGETDDNIRLLMRAVAGVSSDAAAVIPKSMDLEFIDGKQGSSGVDLYDRLLQYLDRQISKLVIGQTATTDADTGGLGSGKEHGDVRDDIRDADAEDLADTLAVDLIKPMVDLNFGVQEGEDRGYPELRIGREETVDPVKVSNAIVPLIDRGLKVSMSEVRDKMGFSDPGKEDELLVPLRSAAPAEPPLDDKGPQDGQKPPGGAPTVAKKPSDGSQGLLGPLKEALALAAMSSVTGRDAIDVFTGQELSGWEAVIDPIIAPIEETLAKCSTLEEARDRLASAIAGIDPSALAQLLARAGFAARLAGEAGLQLGDAR